MGIISNKTVYKAKYFSITQKEIERDGKRFTKDFIERVPAILVIPYTDNNEIYLEYQYRDALNKSIFELVAGNMEEDADPLEAAKRELKEETGLRAEKWEKLATWDLSVNMIGKIHVFAATDLQEGESELNDDEVIETKKLPFEEVLQKVMSGEIPAASHIAALLLFEKLRNQKAL
jgi:8-oxo-dGTP pyrophosphatase MutT (NUDIX family)